MHVSLTKKPIGLVQYITDGVFFFQLRKGSVPEASIYYTTQNTNRWGSSYGVWVDSAMHDYEPLISPRKACIFLSRVYFVLLAFCWISSPSKSDKLCISPAFFHHVKWYDKLSISKRCTLWPTILIRPHLRVPIEEKKKKKKPSLIRDLVWN